jgi:hypothetical protein
MVKKTAWNKVQTVFCGRFKTVHDFSSRIQILDGLGKTVCKFFIDGFEKTVCKFCFLDGFRAEGLKGARPLEGRNGWTPVSGQRD